MGSIVGVTRGTDKFASFKELLKLTNFDDTLLLEFKKSHKNKKDFRIIIKPNMMVYVNPKDHEVVVTDKELVEYLVDHVISLGFSDISVCEARNDVGRMLQNHTVDFVSQQIGYEPKGRYKIVDLSLESLPFTFLYKGKKGNIKKWKDKVGKSWKEADFRITFAKLKTHEHDWMTLAVKNVYGCFPPADKVAKYHIKSEVWIATSRLLRNFTVHFAFVDGWVASDGFQGYKIPNPKPLKMLFGGQDAVAVDTEIFKRAGLKPEKSKFLKATMEQLADGKLPGYEVKGDKKTMFKDLCDWDNIEDKTVETINVLEEVYVAWGFINLKPAAMSVDYELFPPKGWLNKFLVALSQKLYKLFNHFRWYRKLYERK